MSHEAVPTSEAHQSLTAPLKDEVYQRFDYVMVFKLEEDGTQSGVCKHCILSMLGAGLEVYPYLSIQKDELIVLIGCPDVKLKEFADKMNFQLELDPQTLEEVIRNGNPSKNIAGLDIRNGTPENPNSYGRFYDPYEFIYGRYDQVMESFIINHSTIGPDGSIVKRSIYGEEECRRAIESEGASPNDVRCLYKRSTHYGQSTVFPPIIRLKLIYYILEGSKHEGGCGLLMAKFISEKVITSFYPLHDMDFASQVQDKCNGYLVTPARLPFAELRQYFGERFTLFYVFLGHYFELLRIPALIGLVFQIVVWSYYDFSFPVLPFFGVLLSGWAIVFLETWKRKECTTALKCGMSEFESAEPDRPEYTGEMIKSFINGAPMVYFPEKNKRRRVATSVIVVASFILLIVGVVASIYVLRFSLQPQIGRYASYLASAINAVQIQIFNTVYNYFATLMTNRENHRTDTSYQDSMIAKTFLFQFVNSYSSFFFLAFIAGNLAQPTDLTDDQKDFQGQCGYENCMEPLSINVSFIFLTRLVSSAIVQIMLPIVMNKRKFKQETEGYDPASMSRAEIDYLLTEYNIGKMDLANMADVAIEYGYMILFVVALPISCLWGMVNTYAKTRFGIWRHFNLLQRPIPKGVQDIGTWQTIFELLSYIAVCTNGGIICFTMDVLNGYSLVGRLWIFIGFQWTIITMQMVVAYAIPDVPDNVEVQLQRQTFYVSKVIDLTPDEMKEGEEETKPTSPTASTMIRSMASFRNSKANIKHSHFDKKYADVSNIPPCAHPTTTPTAACLATLLVGEEAKRKLMPPRPDAITSSADLDARYGRRPSSATSLPVPPAPSAEAVAIAPVAPPAAPEKDIELTEGFTQVNKAGGDSDDESSFPQAKVDA